MRRRAATDKNQASIVESLRRIGATVVSLHAVGNGCPDLVVGYRGKNFLMEVKNGSKLREKQITFLESWKGQTCVVNNIEEALNIINEATKENS